MASKKKKVTLDRELRDWVKDERAAGRMPFFDSDGNAGSVKRQKGAKRGHRVCR